MFRLSPSGLSLYRDCPRCFWLLYRENKRRPGIFPSLPSGMDRVLKEHFDGFMRQSKLPPELAALQGYTLFADEGLLKTWRNNRRGVQWEDEQGNVFRGAVDNILQRGERLVVLDYKTRGYPLKEDSHKYYQDQMNCYTFLLRKNGYETEDYAYLLFYYPSKVNASGEVVFHTDLVKMPVYDDAARVLFGEALRVLAGDCPAATSCGFCLW